MDINKTQENRLRRVAERRGFILRKARRRDPLAFDYGKYGLFHAPSENPVFDGGLMQTTPYVLTASEVADFLQVDL